MPASPYTFDLLPARRPSLADVGGAAKENDAEFPPNPVTDPTAEEHNFFARAVQGYGRVVASAVLRIEFSAGAPFVHSVKSPRSSLLVSSFALTDAGTGTTNIGWSAGVLPPVEMLPHAWVIVDGAFLQPTVTMLSGQSFVVKTRGSGGALVGVPFQVTIL